MNKPAVLFGATTLLLAVSTGYLYRQLENERQRATPVAHQTAGPLPSDRPIFAPQDAKIPTGSSQPSGYPTEPEYRAKMEEARALDDKRRRTMLEDPESRAAMVRAVKARRRMEYKALKEYVGLTADETERLLQLLADQTIGGTESTAHCPLTKPCDPAQASDANAVAHDQQLELLGTEKYEKFQTYNRTLTERGEVSSFNEQLPAEDSMSREQREKLIAAFADWRSQLRDAATQQGVSLEGIGTPSVYYLSTDTTLDRQIESINRNSAHLRERAAQILTKQQSEVFNQMQDDLVDEYRAYSIQVQVFDLKKP